ncbi:hypothetical protein ACFDTO_28385 [Microbacteriaceae bacterium 4G12]
MLAVLVAMAAHLAAHVSMLVAQPGWSVDRFRNYFPLDQLAYMSMVKNASEGELANVEPFTETGVNQYPHLYYTVLGLISRVFGLHPVAAWQIVGVLVQLLLVAVLGAVLIRVSGRWWSALLAPLPFVLGTYSWLRGDSWFTPLESHAVLWGPFGVLFTLNGESVSLCLASVALLGLVVVWFRPASPRTRVLVTAGASLLIGLLANVQTYSFLAAVYAAVYVLAVWAILRRRSVVLAVVTVVLVPATFLLGPGVVSGAGQLPALVFGMLPAVPGLIAVVFSTRGRVLGYVALAVLGASPQVVLTVVGVATGDPFLSYRTASNRDLGVEPFVGWTSALPLLLPLAVLLWAALRTRRAPVVAYVFGMSATWVVLASNDLWGANAEPYRLWINLFFYVAVTILPVTALVLRSPVPAPGREAGEAPGDTERDDDVDGEDADGDDAADSAAADPEDSAGVDEDETSRRRRSVPIAVATVVAVAVALGSTVDWMRFAGDSVFHQVLAFDTPRDDALTEVVDERPDPELLVGMDPCIDAQHLKILTGARLAHYHVGMAWPTAYEPLARYMESRIAGTLDADALVEADGGYVLTDSACGADWPTRHADLLVPLAREGYETADGEDGTVSLWAVKPPIGG